jgi:hypothetical protein
VTLTVVRSGEVSPAQEFRVLWLLLWRDVTENLKEKKGVKTKIGCGRVDWTCIFSLWASRLNSSIIHVKGVERRMGA